MSPPSIRGVIAQSGNIAGINGEAHAPADEDEIASLFAFNQLDADQEISGYKLYVWWDQNGDGEANVADITGSHSGQWDLLADIVVAAGAAAGAAGHAVGWESEHGVTPGSANLLASLNAGQLATINTYFNPGEFYLLLLVAYAANSDVSSLDTADDDGNQETAITWHPTVGVGRFGVTANGGPAGSGIVDNMVV